MRPPPSVARASNVIVHIGVGTPSPPDGNVSVSASAEPDIDPAIVPVLNLWQDAHEPSAAFSGDRSAEPESVDPLCVTIHDIFSAPCGSVPVPVHAPARVVGGGPDGGAGGEGAGAAVGEDGELQPTAASIAPTSKDCTRTVFMARSPG